MNIFSRLFGKGRPGDESDEDTATSASATAVDEAASRVAAAVASLTKGGASNGAPASRGKNGAPASRDVAMGAANSRAATHAIPPSRAATVAPSSRVAANAPNAAPLARDSSAAERLFAPTSRATPAEPQGDVAAPSAAARAGNALTPGAAMRTGAGHDAGGDSSGSPSGAQRIQGELAPPTRKAAGKGARKPRVTSHALPASLRKSAGAESATAPAPAKPRKRGGRAGKGAASPGPENVAPPSQLLAAMVHGETAAPRATMRAAHGSDRPDDSRLDSEASAQAAAPIESPLDSESSAQAPASVEVAIDALPSAAASDVASGSGAHSHDAARVAVADEPVAMSATIDDKDGPVISITEREWQPEDASLLDSELPSATEFLLYSRQIDATELTATPAHEHDPRVPDGAHLRGDHPTACDPDGTRDDYPARSASQPSPISIIEREWLTSSAWDADGNLRNSHGAYASCGDSETPGSVATAAMQPSAHWPTSIAPYSPPPVIVSEAPRSPAVLAQATTPVVESSVASHDEAQIAVDEPIPPSILEDRQRALADVLTFAAGHVRPGSSPRSRAAVASTAHVDAARGSSGASSLAKSADEARSAQGAPTVSEGRPKKKPRGAAAREAARRASAQSAAPAHSPLGRPSDARTSSVPVAEAALRGEDVGAGRNGGEAAGQNGDETFLANELDARFDALVGDDGARASTGSESVAFDERDDADVRALLVEVAADYMRHVRDFMLDVHAGEPTREWLAVCAPAVRALARAAATTGMGALHEGLEGFAHELERAAGHPTIDRSMRDALLRAYDVLPGLVPGAFGLEEERARREPVIVEALLQRVPEVSEATLAKVRSAGLTRLEAFYAASSDELARATGVAPAVAERILEAFRSYRLGLRATASIESDQSPDRERLVALLAEMRRQDDALDGVIDGWAGDAAERKRALRHARTDTLLQAKILLARLGEVDLVHELDKLPFPRKIVRIAAFLRGARSPMRAVASTPTCETER